MRAAVVVICIGTLLYFALGAIKGAQRIAIAQDVRLMQAEAR